MTAVERVVYTLTCDRCGGKRYIPCMRRKPNSKPIARQNLDIRCDICRAHLTDDGNGKYQKVLCFIKDGDEIDGKKSEYFSEFKVGEVIDSEKYPALVLPSCERSHCWIINIFGDVVYDVPIAKITSEGASKIMNDDEVPVIVECPHCKKIYDILLMSSKGKEKLYLQ